MSIPGLRLCLVAATLAATDGRKHRYAISNKGPLNSQRDDEPPPQPIPETFLRELVATFKANDDAESLVLPSSLTRSERRLVHIYAAKQGLGHKSIRGGSDQRYAKTLMLRKDDAWVARRKRRYIEAEMSHISTPEAQTREPRTRLGLLEYSWAMAVATYCVFA